MNRKLSVVLAAMLLSGCSVPITPQGVIEGHKAKRVETLTGPVEQNYIFSLQLLPKCYKSLNFANSLYAQRYEENGSKFILLGNNIKGGTGLFEFMPSKKGNTNLIAHNKSWYDIDVELFHRYVDGIVSNNINICD
ncbi:hypothetical protein [Neptuniibacter sp. QD34_54]|uniref:hypothetical protein n=1 Tax=Neptuniibacter sp. QD34_54 TaxID=3398208 RepID=UPI0039F53532